MCPSTFARTHVRIGGAFAAAIAALLMAGFSGLEPGHPAPDGGFAAANSDISFPPLAHNGVLSTRVRALDLSQLTSSSYGD